MAFDIKTINRLFHAEETITGPNATTVFTGVLSDARVSLEHQSKYITVLAKKSVVAVGTVTIDLYGSTDEAGTAKFLLKSTVATGVSNTGYVAGTVDLNANPAPYYFIGIKSTGNDSNGTVNVKVIG